MIVKIFKYLKYPVFKQLENSDCGVESLRMVLAYHKLNYEKAIVSKQFTVDEFGTNFYAIQTAANNLGLECIAAKVSLQDLSQIPLPAIIHWNHDHFVVVYEVAKDKIWVGDPAKGLDLISASEFVKSCFNGDNLQIPKANVLIFEKSKLKLPTEIRKASTFNSKVKLKYFITSLIAATSLGFLLILSYFFVCNHHFIFGDNEVILGLMSVGLFVLSLMFLKIYSLPFYHDIKLADWNYSLKSTDSGEFVNSKVNDFLNVYSLSSYLINNAFKFWLSLVVLGGSLILMFCISFKFSFLTCFISIFYFFFRWFNLKFSENEESLNIAGASAVQNELSSFLVKVLEYSKVGKKIEADFNIRPIDNFTKFGLIKPIGWVQNLTLLAGFLSIFILFHYKHLNNCQVIWLSCLFVIIIVTWDNILNYCWHQHKYNQNYSISSNKKSLPNQYLTLSPTEIIPVLDISHMSFRYPSGNFDGQLKNINFKIDKGNKLAVVGRQGSGKSTLFSLLEGNQFPASGSISLGGYSLKDLEPAVLRHHIGICSDSSEILAGSISWNITFENVVSNTKRLREIIDVTLINRFILTLSDGINTYLDPQKEYISDGLKRKIILARLLYQNKNIMLIDFQDRYSDLIETLTLYDSVFQYASDKTIIYSSNNNEMIQLADNVLEIENGEQIQFCKASHFESVNNSFLL